MCNLAEETLELLQKKLDEHKENLVKLEMETKDIKSKIKMQKLKLKKEENKKKINGNTSNVLIRVSTELDSHILDIQEERGDSISKPTITSLLCRHKLWKRIKEDLINFEVYNNNKRW